MSPHEDNTVLSQDDIDALFAQPPAAAQPPAPAASAPAVAQAAPPAQSGARKGGPAFTVSASPQLEGGPSQLVQRVEKLEAALAQLGWSGTDPLLKATVDGLAQQLQALSAQVNEILQHLPNTLGYDARATFQCGSCGTHGYVASRVVCTHCGTDTYVGWWPQQQ